MRCLFAWALAASACSTPCEALRQHADECGSAVGRWADSDESICSAARQENGAGFDAFARCVSESSCAERGAIDRCQAAHLPAAADDACRHYRLWSAACALEPTGTEDDCAGVGATAGAGAFARWVSCVTADGCPARDDGRWQLCRDAYLPEQATLILDACILVERWTGECAGKSEIIPVEEISVPMCIAQADPFTAESYYEYALCLQSISCDSVTDRLDCLLRLQITERSRIEEQCAALIAFTESCDSLIAGGTVEACIRLYARFTADSIDAYSRCLEAGACGDPEVAVGCGSLLQLQ